MIICHVSRVVARKKKHIVSFDNDENQYEHSTEYSFLLNNKVWVNNINPDDQQWCRVYRKRRLIAPKLAVFSEENSGLEALAGNYLLCHLEKNKYGNKITDFYSLDLQQDITDELTKFKGELREISSTIPLYNFLVLKGYPKNKDGSISSQKTSKIRVIQSYNTDYLYNNGDIAIEPYLPTQRTDILTARNIEHIYNEFYYKKSVTEKIEGTFDYESWEHSYKYNRRIGIYVESDKWRTSMKMHVKDNITSTIKTDIIKLGDKLNNEYNKYLTSVMPK